METNRKKQKTAFFCSLFILCLFPLQAWAQNAKVSGRVLEESTGNGIPFANVVLVSARDSSQVMGIASSDSGRFLFKRVPAGRYFVQVAVLGFHRNNSEMFTVPETGSEIRLAPIELVSQAVQLDMVVVRAKRPVMEMKPGKITMNVSQALVTQADNAFEMLKKFPGVTIDKDDNISLNGKSGVLVTIDDRPTHLSGQNLANLLRSMPGNTVERIEVMTNPSSKYEAEGTGGIINLKTTRIQNTGFSGSVNAGIRAGKSMGYNGGLDLNYRHKKFTVYGNASVYQGSNNTYVYSYDRYENGSRNETNGTGSESRTPAGSSRYLSFFGQGGIDYYAGKKDVLSLTYRGNGYTGSNATDRMQTRFYPLAESDSAAYSYNQTARGNYRGQDHNLNFNYEHTFDTVYGNKLSINADWIHNTTKSYGNNNIAYYPGDFDSPQPLFEDPYYTSQPFRSDIYSIKADYAHTFNMQTTLEAGLKFSYVDNDTRNLYQGTDTSDNHFLYDEMIGAAYLMLNHTFKTRTSLQVGIRTEYTYTEGRNLGMDTVNTNGYIRPFPNLTVTQPIGQKNMLSLSYRYRLTRPQYNQLNPFELRSQAQEYRCGNPYLQPEYSHNLDLTYSFNYKFFATLSYIHTDGTFNDIATYRSIPGGQGTIRYNMPVNSGKSDQIGLSLNTQLTFYKIWRLMLFVNGNYGRSETLYEGLNITRQVFNANYWFNTEIDVHPRITISAYSWGNIPSRDIFTRSAGMYGGGIGLKAFFFNKTLTLSASFDGIFNPYEIRSSYPGANGEENVSFNRYDWDRLSGQIRLSYRFGNNRLINRAPRQIEKSEEASRLGGGNTGSGHMGGSPK